MQQLQGYLKLLHLISLILPIFNAILDILGGVVMRRQIDRRVPSFDQLIVPTFNALKELGGSGSNDEILNRIISDLNIPDDVVDIPHNDSTTLTEIAYRAAWSRTYMKSYGVISNSARAVWSINPDFAQADTLDAKRIVSEVRLKQAKAKPQPEEKNDYQQMPIEVDDDPEDDGVAEPDEVKPWRTRLAEILQSMNPYGFERLTQRILRECGFSQVEVTKKSRDGGIDGTGKWKINGIFSFNVAFQCKRYSEQVSADAIRDFRGSLTTDIEKGVLITTGTFSKAAKEEASNPGKQQIDLIDGEELINKIAEYGIGVKEVKSYEIDEEFFNKI